MTSLFFTSVDSVHFKKPHLHRIWDRKTEQTLGIALHCMSSLSGRRNTAYGEETAIELAILVIVLCTGENHTKKSFPSSLHLHNCHDTCLWCFPDPSSSASNPPCTHEPAACEERTHRAMYVVHDLVIFPVCHACVHYLLVSGAVRFEGVEIESRPLRSCINHLKRHKMQALKQKGHLQHREAKNLPPLPAS